MGLGDILMSMGEAKALHRRTGQPVLIVGRDGRPVEHHGLFDGVPYLLTAPTNACNFQRLKNGPGLRPYIAGKTPRMWTWSKYAPLPAELKFTASELQFADRYRGAVMIEPNVKDIGHMNKAWPMNRWVELTAALRELGIPTVQCGPGGTSSVADVFALTPSFRYAAAVLSVSRAFVGTEGGLMHAAAAVGTPSVILWSEFISPQVTGYREHKHIRHAGPACGMRVNCSTCRKSMGAIGVGEVTEAIREVLNEKS